MKPTQKSRRAQRLRCLLAVCILCWITGCAGPRNSVTFDPSIPGPFSARTAPPEVSKESVASLLKNGYVKIGTVVVEQAAERCEGDVTKDNYSYYVNKKACAPLPSAMDVEAAALEKAVAQGGDKVTFQDKDRVFDPRDERRREVTKGFEMILAEFTFVNDRFRYSVWRQDPEQKEVRKALLDNPAIKTKEDYTRTLAHTADGVPVEIVNELLRRGAAVVWVYDADALANALAAGNVDVVKTLLEHGSPVPAWSFLLAVSNSNYDLVKLLLDHKANVNGVAVVGGDTPLIVAVDKGDAAIAKLLLDRRANVNAKDKNGATALIRAVGKGDAAIAKMLLDRGADVNVQDKDGKTALNVAEQGGHAALAKSLVARGARFNDEELNVELLKATLDVKPELVKTLIARGGTLPQEAMNTALGIVALKRSEKEAAARTAEILIKMGADPLVELPEHSEVPLILFAASSGNVELVKLFLAHKASPNSETKTGVTALMYAAQSKDPAPAKLLLAHGADLGKKDRVDGETALMTAAFLDNVDTMEVLLAAGAELNTRDVRGRNAFMQAAAHGAPGSVKALLAHGADLNARDIYGRTALTLAKERLKERIKALRFAEGHYPNDDFHIRIEKAALQRLDEVIELLKKTGMKE